MVTHQLQVERRTGKVRRPETDVLPLCHAINYSLPVSPDFSQRTVRQSVAHRRPRYQPALKPPIAVWLFRQQITPPGKKVTRSGRWQISGLYIRSSRSLHPARMPPCLCEDYIAKEQLMYGSLLLHAKGVCLHESFSNKYFSLQYKRQNALPNFTFPATTFAYNWSVSFRFSPRSGGYRGLCRCHLPF